MSYSKNILFLLIFWTYCLNAQNVDTLSIEKYERAEKLKWRNISNKIYHLHVNPNWRSDNTGFWFIDQTPQGQVYKHLDFKTMAIKEIFNHVTLSQQLNKKFDLKTEANNLNLGDLVYKAANIIKISVNGRNFNYDLKKETLSEVKKDETPYEFEAASPNGKWIAFVRDYNLYINQGMVKKRLN